MSSGARTNISSSAVARLPRSGDPQKQCLGLAQILPPVARRSTGALPLLHTSWAHEPKRVADVASPLSPKGVKTIHVA